MGLTGKFIITADWHLTDVKPRCRLDKNWIETQRKTIQYIFDFSIKQNYDIFCLGDLFDRPIVNIKILYYFLKELWDYPNKFFVLAGNHELPNHSYLKIQESFLGILDCLSNFNNFPIFPIKIFKGVAYKHFGEKVINNYNSNILCLHQLIFESEKSKSSKKIKALIASELLKQYPEFDYIFVGDNHHSFVYEENGRYVFNPGCILRNSVDMKDYKPSFFYVEFENGVLKKYDKIYIPDSEELVTDIYLQEEKVKSEMNDKISAFVSCVKLKTGLSLSFMGNLKRSMDLDTGELGEAKSIIFEIMEERK